MTFSEAVDLTSKAVTALGIITIIITYWQTILNKKVLYLTVMERCINRFTEVYPNLLEPLVQEPTFRSYIELTNEELFYISKRYLAKEVALEWIDGMLTFIPVYNRKKQLINENALLLNYNWDEIYKGYPRIEHFMKENYFFSSSDMEIPARRKVLVEILYDRMKEYKY